MLIAGLCGIYIPRIGMGAPSRSFAHTNALSLVITQLRPARLPPCGSVPQFPHPDAIRHRRRGLGKAGTETAEIKRDTEAKPGDSLTLS